MVWKAGAVLVVEMAFGRTSGGGAWASPRTKRRSASRYRAIAQLARR